MGVVETDGFRVYRGTWHAVRSMVRHEGWLTFYRGFGVVLTNTVPGHALYFGGYELAKKMLRKHTLAVRARAVRARRRRG